MRSAGVPDETFRRVSDTQKRVSATSVSRSAGRDLRTDLVWWGRLGDIPRFEPTKSGADSNYAKGPQDIRRDAERDGVLVGTRGHPVEWTRGLGRKRCLYCEGWDSRTSLPV